MILDILQNAHHYDGISPLFGKAFDFLMRPETGTLPAGKYEIDTDRVYAMVSIGPGRRKEAARLEIHRKYIDIQMVLDGTDTMGWRPMARCNDPAGEYEPKSDLQFFNDTPEAWIDVKSGAFAVFFPEDAHMPLISPGQIHKVVVKIAVRP